MCGSRYLCLLVALVLLLAGCSYGQTHRADSAPDFGIQLPSVDVSPGDPAPVLPRPIFPRPVGPGTFGFTQLAQSAGTIFSGTVTSIKRVPKARSPALETVAVTFQVENAIRGATPGQNLTISQWMG